MDSVTNKRLGYLISEIARGNLDALSEIYTIMCRILYAVGNIYLKQKADIEDAIQNLLVKLAEVAQKFRKNKNACAWIIKIYRHLILNSLKHRNTEEKYLSDEMERLKFNDKIVDETYLENHLFFKEILSNLSNCEKELLINRYVCNFSIGELAVLYKKPKSTMESRLIKLEQKIKKF